MQGELRKPVFVKVSDLQNGRSGFNVYVKVVSVEKSETQGNVPIVRAVVADETGAANAFFKGDTAKLIVEGAVLAIRNGTIKFIKNKISLEIDMFGRVTPEKLDIKTNTEVNISEKQMEKKNRKRNNNNDREEGDRPRRENGDRRPRREGDNDRRPRREDNNDRRPRREGDNDRRPRRQEDNDRRPRREDRRQGDDRRPRGGDFDRRPRRQGDNDRRPRREGDNDRRPRREDDRRGDRRAPVTFTKIGAFEPADDNLNFFAKVISVQQVGKRARVVLGDETGTVKAFLYRTEHITEGQTIVLFRAEARVVKEHIEVQLMDGGKIDAARRKIEEVQKTNNISAKEWIEADN